MIEHYSDHAANERTFLAWVRTSIAVMAFGFLVEKFDLFLAIAGQTTGRMISPRGEAVGSIAGLLLILLGGAMLALSMVRFRKTARDIASPDKRMEGGARMDLLLTGLLLLLGAALFCYLIYSVVGQMNAPAA